MPNASTLLSPVEAGNSRLRKELAARKEERDISMARGQPEKAKAFCAKELWLSMPLSSVSKYITVSAHCVAS